MEKNVALLHATSKVMTTKLYCIPQKLSAFKSILKQRQANKLRRKTWLSNPGCQATVSSETYVCQRHFVSGKI
jgi:hypothetical protein